VTIQVISIPDFIDTIHHVCVRNREPLMCWGKPGVGKSEGVRASLAQLLTSTGLTFEGPGYRAGKSEAATCDRLVDIRLSQYDSVDLRGIPVPHAGMTVWHAPVTLPFKGNPNFSEDDIPIYLFLDEINSAAPSVAAVAYQLINDRSVGEHRLMDNVVVIAAGNREQDRGVTNRMPTPLANRFTHVEVDVDVDAWCYWAQENGLSPEGVAFMQFRKPLLCTFDPSKPDKAFATPRSWKKALTYFADQQMPDHIKQAAMTGAVGEGPAAEFWGFVDVWAKMPKMSDIEAKPDSVPVPGEAAMRYAVAVAISGTLTPKNTGPFSMYLERMDPEFAVLAWQLGMRRDPTISGTQDFIAFSKKYRAIFAR
jgi:hypothetical protein